MVKQVEPLRKLLEVRNKLADLRNKMGGNDKLEELLMDVLQNTEKLKTLGKEFGREAEVKDPSSDDRA
ncbi:type VI secretion protein [Pseudomonas putida]|nr:type VI secretion protein [Pseudomonas putida]